MLVLSALVRAPSPQSSLSPSSICFLNGGRVTSEVKLEVKGLTDKQANMKQITSPQFHFRIM